MSAILYRVILPVADIEQAAAFYGQVLEQPGERVSGGRHYFTCGGVILACYDPAADGDDVKEGWRMHESQYLYFVVADLPGALARMRAAGASILADIADMPWGERIFYALDPFGNRVAFVDAATVFTGSA